MSHQHNRPKFINNIKNTAVIESPVHGYGLFATSNIKKGSLLCELSGQIITKKQFEKIMSSNLYPIELFIEKHQISDELMMITPFRTSYSFINHSVEIENLIEVYEYGRVKVYASDDIYNGAEILSKYNLTKHIDILGGFNV